MPTAALVLVLTALTPKPVVAQQPQPATVSPDLGVELETIRAKFNLPALAVRGVVWDDREGTPETMVSAQVGVRAAGGETPVTPGDAWHIGSCTKAMTATLLATYVAEGGLAWDDTLAEALPELVDDMSEAAAGATIAELLRHRAGMPANPTGVLMLRLYGEGAQAGRRAAILEALAEAHSPPGPGEPGRYSNFGYMIAGVIAERLGGKHFETLVVERVLTPLGIEEGQYGFGPPPAGDDPDAPAQPVGHAARRDRSWEPRFPGPRADNPPAFGPAGTMHLTLDAWGRFCMAHARGDDLAEGERDALGLSWADYAELHRPVETFAAGWVVAERGWAGGGGEGDGPVLTHNGSNTLWFATAWIAPQKDWVLLSATNAMGPMAAVACDQAVGAALGEMAR